MQITAGLLLKFLKILSLAHNLAALEEMHLGILRGEEGRGKQCLFLIGLAVEDIKCQLQQLVATGGIDI